MITGVYAAVRHNPLDCSMNTYTGLEQERMSVRLPALYGFWGCEEGVFDRKDAFNTGILTIFACGALGWFVSGRIIFGILSAVAGFILIPRFYGAYRQALWKLAVLKALPGGTFSLLVSLRSGMSIKKALESAAATSKQPVAGEFLNMSQEIESGIKEDEAAENFGRRLLVREGRVLGNVLARFIRLGGGTGALELLEEVQGMLRGRDIVRDAVRSGLADLLGDATIAMITTTGFFLLGFLLMPDIYKNVLSTSTGKMVIYGGMFQAVLVQVWVRWKCRKLEGELS
ncbi:type II secretion system F family protein [Pelotomaculum terephthalicicum JT]|uniref:type II secretion system F family protein n=1 Tax=Pelotomaculum TaxID=191373 RepID=UPI0009C5CBDB|nr:MULTISPECIES: type II secretion system F family protein [Pelotomaculum]MCG9969619.1 type II secretion system F family protein [Pelotomaculum terephthalicicum JT]OPX91766.1 MAG: Bacterial type II secretion system protein F domain protein [Pelotomaculum sp. PtaB.Bin117]